MNASQYRFFFNWANAQSFPPLGMDPPDLGEARTTIGGGRQERAVIQRDRYEALIGGFVQCLDTVSLAWSVVPSVMRRGRTNDGQVKVHVPLIWFGKVGHDDYRDALITAAWMTFHVSPSSIKGQILVYNYFVTLLKESASVLERLPPFMYDSRYIESLRRSMNNGTMEVPKEEYPVAGPRWAFEATGDDTQLRVDVQAPTPHRFSCVVILRLASLPPRRQPCLLARKLGVINRVHDYIRALRENDIPGQYAH